MQTSVRRSYQYCDQYGDLNNPRQPFALQLDSNGVIESTEQQQHLQYSSIETQQQLPLFQHNQFQHQLPLAEHQLDALQHEHQHPPSNITSEPQNYECFLDATTTTTCYSLSSIQPQLDTNLRAQVLSTPNYQDNNSLQQCQLLNSHVVLNVENPIERPHNNSTINNKQQDSATTNLYHQELQNEATSQPVYQQQALTTVYYEPPLLDGSGTNCAQLEQSTYHLNQLVATQSPLHQVSPTDTTCNYFQFQPTREQQLLAEQNVQPIHPQDSTKYDERIFQEASVKFATFSSSQPIELSPHLQELFQPTIAINAHNSTRYAVESHLADQHQQHNFQEQTRVPDIEHYQELVKQPNVATHGFSYLESGSVERRQTFEPSLASQEETQSSSDSSISCSEDSASSILTRDEKKAREANIPLAYNDIINLSIEQFNEQLSKYNLSESQLNLIKDIRRRGKNKVAAQSCRKRKMEQISELQQEVEHLSSKRKSLNDECNQLMETHERLVQEYDKVYSMVQEHLTTGQQQQQSQAFLMT